MARKKTTTAPAVYSGKESDPTLRAYKEKFLKQAGFASETGVKSQVIFAYLLLALGREDDAEAVADYIAGAIDLDSPSLAMREAAWRAARLSAWRKALRREDIAGPMAIAARLAHQVDRWDKREMRRWLVEDAEVKLSEARGETKSRSAYLTLYSSFGPLIKELHERVSGVPREKVEQLYDDAKAILRGIVP